MSAAHDVSATDNSFDLIVRDAKPGFRLRFNDSGVRVDSDALAVMRDGEFVRIPFAEIRSVQLSLASTGRSGCHGRWWCGR